jgi:hypothetical protein
MQRILKKSKKLTRIECHKLNEVVVYYSLNFILTLDVLVSNLHIKLSVKIWLLIYEMIERPNEISALIMLAA